LAGVNWGRDLPEPDLVADIRNVVAGDPSPDGQGTLGIARGIEVGHVFALGRKYSEAMKMTVLDANGKAVTPTMGCYGVGVSRIVAAAIEQNHDAAGIIWPEAMAPWQVAVCMINPKNDANVAAAAQALYDELNGAGFDAVLDDRGLRPGAMFADIELIGIPHRVVVSERGIAAGTFEYRARRASEAEQLGREALFARLTAG
jgi:prolyl-tRNA synthetase